MNNPDLTDDKNLLPVSQRLDNLPITRIHLAIFIICTIGLFADIAEVSLSNALAAIFMAPPHSLPRSSLSLLLASVFAGGAIGAPIFGLLGDRVGRKFALRASLALMALGSLAAAMSSGLIDLTIARAVSGIAIGGFPPLIAVYLSEVMPPRRRGAMLMTCAGIGFLGGSAVILFVQALSPASPLGIEPWRWALIIGAALSALAAVLFSFVPESPRWLASAGRSNEADKACRRFEQAARRHQALASSGLIPETLKHGDIQPALTQRSVMRRSALFVILYALAPWATLGFPLLSAVVLLQKGYNIDQSLIFAALSMLGPPMGALLSAGIIDRLERRSCLVALAGVMTIAGLVFSASTGFTMLVITGIIFNTAAAIYGAMLPIYASELLPTHLRASVLNCSWAVGRVATAIAPFVLLPTLATYGPSGMFAVLTAALIVSGTALLYGPRGLSGKTINQSSFD